MNSEEYHALNAIRPLLKLISVTVIGVIIAHPKIQLVPKSTYKILSKIVFALFLPCLIFTYLGQSITLQKLIQWWFIPVNTIISTGIGCLLGYAVALICRPPREFFRFTVIMTGFGNTGNIALAVVSSVCQSSDLFGPGCYSSGLAFVSYSQWVSAILVCTLVYHMMEPPLEYYQAFEEFESDETDIEEIECLENNVDSASISTPLLVQAEWPGFEDKETKHCKTPFIANLFNSISGYSQARIEVIEDACHSPKSGPSCLSEPRMVKKMRIIAKHTPIEHMFQPPMIACILAIMVGTIPAIKNVVFGDDAPLEFITDSLSIMGEAMVPLALLIIGGMVGEGPNESRLGIRTTIGITITRLLLLPLVGIGIVCLADKWGLLIPGEERLYKFVLLLQYTTPSAILMGAVASLRGYAISEASALLFWQHVFALVSLSFYTIIYFKFFLSF